MFEALPGTPHDGDFNAQLLSHDVTDHEIGVMLEIGAFRRRQSWKLETISIANYTQTKLFFP